MPKSPEETRHKQAKSWVIVKLIQFANTILKDAQTLSIIAFLDHIRSMHQAWFAKRREIALSRENVLSDHSEPLLKYADLRSKRYVVYPINHHELEILDGPFKWSRQFS